MTKRKKKKLARRMGFRHYRDAKAINALVDISTDIHTRLFSDYEETLNRIRQKFTGFMSAMYRYALRTGTIPDENKLMEAIENESNSAISNVP